MSGVIIANTVSFCHASSFTVFIEVAQAVFENGMNIDWKQKTYNNYP